MTEIKTLCWNCSTEYDNWEERCPRCCASNGNINPAQARAEACEGQALEHDWKFEDASFGHEFGIQKVHFWECRRCGVTTSERPEERGEIIG